MQYWSQKSLFSIYFSQLHTNRYDSQLDVLVIVLRSQQRANLLVLQSCLLSPWILRQWGFLVPNAIIVLPRGHSARESACQCRRCKRCGFSPWGGKIPWRRAWPPSLVFLPGESLGQRSLEGCSPRGRKESAITEHTRTHTITKCSL